MLTAIVTGSILIPFLCSNAGRSDRNSLISTITTGFSFDWFCPPEIKNFFLLIKFKMLQ